MARKIILLIIFVLSAFYVNGQINQNRTDIVRYDFSTYKGTPIQKGWLFDDLTYQKLYTSYNAADSLIKAFEHYKGLMQKFDTLHNQVVTGYEERIADKDKLIQKSNQDIADLNKLLKESDKNVEKIQKQFITIGNIKIHKGTAIKVGLAFGVMGYLIGKF